MAVNMDKWRRKKSDADSKVGGFDYWSIPVGESLIYVCPPMPDDELPFVESAIHYQVGPENKVATCLDEERNPVLQDKRVKKILAENNKDISDGCPVCKSLDEGVNVGKEANSRYFLSIIPLKFRKSASKKWREADDAEELKVLPCGYTVWSGITDVFINNGDVSDPEKAILIRVVREGTGMKTRYTVTADSDSIRDHGISLSKPLKALVKKQVVEGGAGDLYRVVGMGVKSSAEVQAFIEGVPMEEEEEPENENKKPDCFGMEYESDDDDCKGCDHSDECEKECTPPGSKKTPSKPKVPEPEENKDEDEDLDVGKKIKVKDCEEGEFYTEDKDDIVKLTFTGISKKGRKVWGFFEDEDGEKIRLGGSDSVYILGQADSDDPEEDSEGSEEDEDDMSALDRAINNRKKKSAA